MQLTEVSHIIMRGGICNPCINIEYQLLANELGRLVHWSLSCVGILQYGWAVNTLYNTRKKAFPYALRAAA